MPTDDPIGTGGFIGPPIYQIRDHVRAWIGRTMIVEGTVSKVTVEPEFVALFFKEAPDGSFQVFSPLSAELRARFGANLAGLIGKTIRVNGLVQNFEDTDGGIRFVDMAQLKLVP